MSEENSVNHAGLAWTDFESEKPTGTEGGLIIRDEAITGYARITLEEGCRMAPYGITCGGSGFVHTTWTDELCEAETKYEGMKRDLMSYALALDDESFDAHEWVNRFIHSWQ